MRASGTKDSSWSGIVDNGLKDAQKQVSRERAALTEGRSDQAKAEAKLCGGQPLQLHSPAASNKRKEPDTPSLPDGWEEHRSSKDGKVYDFNTIENRSRWNRPSLPKPAPQSPPRPASPPRQSLITLVTQTHRMAQTNRADSQW